MEWKYSSPIINADPIRNREVGITSGTGVRVAKKSYECNGIYMVNN